MKARQVLHLMDFSAARALNHEIMLTKSTRADGF
jgi:hypothetical protein